MSTTTAPPARHHRAPAHRLALGALLGALTILTGRPAQPTPPGRSGGDPGAAPPPVTVFHDLNGTWRGAFVVYDSRGRELSRLRVEQRYRVVDDERQEVEIHDRLPDGRVITGRGVNRAVRLPDGSLALTCRVEKSDGSVVEHRGRVVRGADGEAQLIWWSEAQDRRETFREAVHREGTRGTYTIDGMGLYGAEALLMHGRYRRVVPSAHPSGRSPLRRG